MIGGPNEVGPTFAEMVKVRAGAVVVQGSLSSPRVAELALEHRLPAATKQRSFAEAGGLFSYGASEPMLFKRSAGFVHRILQGAKPADMPIEQPTEFQFALNLKTAKALGLTIPPSLLARADEVIE